MAWYGKVWYGMVWYGMVWYGMVWYGMVWYGMVWYGMVWQGSVKVPHRPSASGTAGRTEGRARWGQEGNMRAGRASGVQEDLQATEVGLHQDAGYDTR